MAVGEGDCRRMSARATSAEGRAGRRERDGGAFRRLRGGDGTCELSGGGEVRLENTGVDVRTRRVDFEGGPDVRERRWGGGPTGEARRAGDGAIAGRIWGRALATDLVMATRNASVFPASSNSAGAAATNAAMRGAGRVGRSTDERAIRSGRGSAEEGSARKASIATTGRTTGRGRGRVGTGIAFSAICWGGRGLGVGGFSGSDLTISFLGGITTGTGTGTGAGVSMIGNGAATGVSKNATSIVDTSE